MSLKAPANRAVIWDMDGVIADTAQYHFQSWQEVLGKRGVPITMEQFRPTFGQRNDSIIRKNVGKTISQSEIDAIAEEKERSFRRRIGAAQDFKPLPGVLALMDSLREHRFRMALASSGPWENIRLLVRMLGVGDYFQAIVAGRDVTESKPSPQIYLLAAQKLGVAPANCIVIEDAIAGVDGAKQAGMHCVAVTTTHPHHRLTGADIIVDSLEEITVNDLGELLISSTVETGTKQPQK